MLCAFVSNIFCPSPLIFNFFRKQNHYCVSTGADLCFPSNDFLWFEAPNPAVMGPSYCQGFFICFFETHTLYDCMSVSCFFSSLLIFSLQLFCFLNLEFFVYILFSWLFGHKLSTRWSGGSLYSWERHCSFRPCHPSLYFGVFSPHHALYFQETVPNIVIFFVFHSNDFELFGPRCFPFVEVPQISHHRAFHPQIICFLRQDFFPHCILHIACFLYLSQLRFLSPFVFSLHHSLRQFSCYGISHWIFCHYFCDLHIFVALCCAFFALIQHIFNSRIPHRCWCILVSVFLSPSFFWSPSVHFALRLALVIVLFLEFLLVVWWFHDEGYPTPRGVSRPNYSLWFVHFDVATRIPMVTALFLLSLFSTRMPTQPVVLSMQSFWFVSFLQIFLPIQNLCTRSVVFFVVFGTKNNQPSRRVGIKIALFCMKSFFCSAAAFAGLSIHPPHYSQRWPRWPRRGLQCRSSLFKRLCKPASLPT